MGGSEIPTVTSAAGNASGGGFTQMLPLSLMVLGVVLLVMAVFAFWRQSRLVTTPLGKVETPAQSLGVYCTSCGAANPAGAKFCIKCGEAIVVPG